MKFIIGLVLGFVGGAYYALWQTVEAPDGLMVKFMEGAKALMELI